MTAIARAASRLATAAAVLLAVLVLAVAFVIPRLTGGAALTVLSGSMTPTYPVGSIVLVVPANPTEIVPGDVITFQTQPGVQEFVTHRVVRVQDTDPLSFVTKGDANSGEDREPVPAGAVRGTVRFHLPYLGSISDFVRTPAGMLTLGGPLLLLFMVQQFANMRSELRRERTDASHDSPTATEKVDSRA
ncbi:signal peptidase I [Egicoccus sp. AB-alg2]|uniref:signal peptidase I n=1 Tax=Egicoccus sp. AB-alg2 TaxID=3242693 RepID=UPI00359E3ED2